MTYDAQIAELEKRIKILENIFQDWAKAVNGELKKKEPNKISGTDIDYPENNLGKIPLLMNEIYYIKVAGKANIPKPLYIGHNFQIKADCSIVSEQKSDLENGEFSITYKAIPLTIEILKDNGEVVRAKDPRKNSQKIRNYLWKIYYDEGYTEDFDRVYDEFTQEVMSVTPTLLKQAIKRINGN